MVRRAPSDQEAEQPGGRLMTGKATNLSEDSWMDLAFSNYLRYAILVRSLISDANFLSITLLLLIAWRLPYQLQI